MPHHEGENPGGSCQPKGNVLKKQSFRIDDIARICEEIF